MSVAHSLDFESYIVACSTCSRNYEAANASWCLCVTKKPSIACPRCAACLCGDAKGSRAFWSAAPVSLVERRQEQIALRARATSIQRADATKVLVVDDDEEIRMIAEFTLQEMGYRTLTASRADEALAIVARDRPAFVLTDALMPGQDGRELCRMIKERFPATKVVIMTSLYTSPRYATEAYRIFHADAYLAKPIDFARLRSVLKRLA